MAFEPRVRLAGTVVTETRTEKKQREERNVKWFLWAILLGALVVPAYMGEWDTAAGIWGVFGAVIWLGLYFKKDDYRKGLRAAYSKLDSVAMSYFSDHGGDEAAVDGAMDTISECLAEIDELAEGGVGDQEIRNTLMLGDKFDRSIVLGCFKFTEAYPTRKPGLLSALLDITGVYNQLEKSIGYEWGRRMGSDLGAMAAKSSSATTPGARTD